MFLLHFYFGASLTYEKGLGWSQHLPALVSSRSELQAG